MTKKKKITDKKSALIITLILILVLFVYLKKELYLNCLLINFVQCLQSNKYSSLSGEFEFRYPKNYPISFIEGDELADNFGLQNYVEWVNFSKEFYPNAGGNRLGSITLEEKVSLRDIEEYIRRKTEEYESSPDKLKGVPPKFQQTKVAGRDAVKVTVGVQPSSFNPPEVTYVFLNDGNLYKIMFSYNDYYHKLPLKEYEVGREIIVSTFRLK